jgi:hypothetical protein
MSEEFFPNDTFKESLDDVTFEQAKKLKKLGFDWNCCKRYRYFFETDKYIIESEKENNYNGGDPTHADYYRFYSCPSIPLALKWIRTKVDYGFEYRMGWAYAKIYWYLRSKEAVEKYVLNGRFYTYEKAEKELLNGLLDDLIKNNKRNEKL